MISNVHQMQVDDTFSIVHWLFPLSVTTQNWLQSHGAKGAIVPPTFMLWHR